MAAAKANSSISTTQQCSPAEALGPGWWPAKGDKPAWGPASHAQQVACNMKHKHGSSKGQWQHQHHSTLLTWCGSRTWQGRQTALTTEQAPDLLLASCDHSDVMQLLNAAVEINMCLQSHAWKTCHLFYNMTVCILLVSIDDEAGVDLGPKLTPLSTPSSCASRCKESWHYSTHAADHSLSPSLPRHAVDA